MTYLAGAELKTYLGISLSSDDPLLTTLIAAAQAGIDSYAHRTFETAADAIRYFDVGADTVGDTLYLDMDLHTITSIITNADGASPITLATTEYFTLPRNGPPYHAIKIAGSSGKYWRYTSDSQAGIKITGKWVYSLVPPADIKMACLRWAGYLYKLRDSQVFDVTSIPEMGQMIIPKGMPQDVKILLDPYIRARL